MLLKGVSKFYFSYLDHVLLCGVRPYFLIYINIFINSKSYPGFVFFPVYEINKTDSYYRDNLYIYIYILYIYIYIRQCPYKLVIKDIVQKQYKPSLIPHNNSPISNVSQNEYLGNVFDKAATYNSA